MWRNWKITAPVAVVLAAVGAWLVFGFFGFHTLFIDEEVDEALPFVSAGPGASGLPGDAVSEEDAAAMNEAMESAGMPATDEADDAPPIDDAAAVVEEARGEFVDRSHPTQGTAVVLGDGTQRFLRLEDFETDNGPDLDVYLSTAAPDAPAGDFDDDFVDLGDLKGNVGNQNYEVPADVDLARYRTVVIWCVRFGVAFGAAPLD